MRSLAAASGAVGRPVLAARWVLAGGLTVYFSFASGGYFPGSVGLAAVLMLAVLVLVVLAGVLPLHGWGLGVAAAAVPLGALAVWTYVSSGWSGSVGRASTETDRVLLYLAVLLVSSSLGWSAARMRGLLLGLLGAAVVVSGIGVVAQLFPGLLHVDHGPHPERLTYPLSYWNGMGLLAGIGVILAVHGASSLEERLWLRCAAAGVTPLLGGTLLLTLSRGALWSSLAGLVVYVLVARPRGLPAAAVAIVPTTVVALLGLEHGAVVQLAPSLIERYDLGGQPAWLLGASMVVAALLRLAGAPLDRALARIELQPAARRAVTASSVAAIAVAVALTAIVARDLGVGDQIYDRFIAGVSPASQQPGAARLVDVSNDNRLSKWRVSLDAFRADPLHGSGAGTYDLSWQRERPTDGNVLDAHSLYIEILGELGLPGLILLGSALLAILAGLLARARGPARAAPAALLAATVAWAISAGFDWDWELPAVTVWIFAAGGLALARGVDAPARRHAPRRTTLVRCAVVAVCIAVAILPMRVTLSEAALQDGLSAAQRGDCATADAAARRSLSAMGSRWMPWQLIGYSAVAEGRLRVATRAFERAAARDPHNWLPRYSEAIAEAGLGRDPSRALIAAFARNPRQRAHSVLATLPAHASAHARRQAASRAQVFLPYS